MKAAPLDRIVLAEKIARHHIGDLIGLHPHRYAEIPFAETRRAFRGHFQPGPEPLECSRGTGCLQVNRAPDQCVIFAAGNVARVTGQEASALRDPVECGILLSPTPLGCKTKASLQ